MANQRNISCPERDAEGGADERDSSVSNSIGCLPFGGGSDSQSGPPSALSILDAMSDPQLFGPWFRRSASWETWRVFLSALFGLPLFDEQWEVFRQYTGRATAPKEAAREAWLVVGRRGGKSLVAALIAVFLACFRDYTKHLAPGEAATIMTIAADRRQARTVIRYITGFLERVPMLEQLVTRRTRESIELCNRVAIEVHTAGFRAVRGYTIAAAICDEVAFWRSDESANPDSEIISALRPGLSTIPGSLLLCISSPYARKGALFEAHQKHYAKENDPVLIWQAPTLAMNPTIDRGIIERAMEEDESSARAEYLAEFRTDVETFVAREAVMAAVVPGRRELPYAEDIRFFGFTDPSGGSSDGFTLAIAHRSAAGKAVLDAVRERRPPFSPEVVVSEYAELLKTYRIREVHGDKYAGEWPRAAFRKFGIEYRVSDQTKSEIYLGLLPMLNSGQVELLEEKRLIAQLCGLERRTARSGKDSVDHGPNSHDDLVNATAGALLLAGDVSNKTTVIRSLGIW